MLRIGFFLVLGLGFFPVMAASDDFSQHLHQGEGYLRQSQYHLALDALTAARLAADTPLQQAQAEGSLGLVHYRMAHDEQAEQHLRQALASRLGSAWEQARWLTALATLEAHRGHGDQARPLYAQALSLAAGQTELTLGIRLGQAALLPSEQKLAALRHIAADLDTLDDAEQRAAYWIHLATEARSLGSDGLQWAYNGFEHARTLAEKQPRLLAEATGGLAQLYEDRHRLAEAEHFNEQALRAARAVDAHDLLLELEWRQGRLHTRQQRFPEAVTAYQRAIDHIEIIRHDIPVRYRDGRSSFRATLEPVYLGLADLLLHQADREPDATRTELLRRARQTVELIKQSELEDFLGGRCAIQAHKSTALETIAEGTAVLYPIILPDRLELLITQGQAWQHFSTPISADRFQTLTRQTAQGLRQGLNHANTQTLYRLLIAPAETWLRQHRVRTLVWVPDGVLRLLPLAALHNGERYLIEDYAVVTSPGLTLFETDALQRRGLQSLLAGMSEPGPVIDQLPLSLLQDLSYAEQRGFNTDHPVSSRTLPMSADTTNEPVGTSRQAELQRLIQDPTFRQNLKKQLSLPGVAEEIHRIGQELPNLTIINEHFTVDNFRQKLTQPSYSIVHIASHGVFGHDADSSFLMAYDQLINMDHLEQLLKSEQFQRKPIQLLTLSACQTAEGDDRAPLGLSGIALKARVRSALGTLWPVSDEAAVLLMTTFYKALAQSNITKVQALQQAQIELLKQDSFKHPFYWSPFILVGNWL